MKLAFAAFLCLIFAFANAQPLVSPVGTDEWVMYYFATIEWDPLDAAFTDPSQATTMTITVTSTDADGDENSIIVIEDFALAENIDHFDWIVHGVAPSDGAVAVVSVELDNTNTFVSEMFTILASPADAVCLGDGEDCADDTECCSESCVDDVCGEYFECVIDGGLCIEEFPCCNGQCNDLGTCGEPDDCTFLDGDCLSDEECCSELCRDDMCVAAECTELTIACSTDEECCSEFCRDDMCVAAECTELTESCSTDDECCFELCRDLQCVDAECTEIDDAKRELLKMMSIC